MLIVDDHDDIRALVREVADDAGLSVMECSDASAVIGSSSHPPETIVLDLQRSGLDGVEVLRRLSKIDCRSRIIIASGQDARVLDSAVTLGRELA